MSNKHSGQGGDLANAVSNFIASEGIKFLSSYEDSSRLLLCWLLVLRKHYLTGTADELLYAVASSVREAAALAALGLVRPTLFSLRAQADLMLSWLYFKDHPIEYRNLCRAGDGFVLKKEAMKYFSDNYPAFSEKLGTLNSIANRKDIDIYRLLSAHVHSQSPFVISEVKDLKDIVRTKELVAQCCSLQRDVSEYLADILFSLGMLNEAAMPPTIRNNVISRAVSPAQRAVLFQ